MPSLEPGSVQRVVLPCDREKQNPTVFLIRALSLRTRARIGDFFTEMAKIENGWKDQIAFLVSQLEGIVIGMENAVSVETGEAVQWCGTASLLDVLSYDDLVPFISAILESGRVNAEEKKS